MAELEDDERSTAVGWSDLHSDLLAETFSRLGVADYRRCLSVCASWRSVPQKTGNFCKPMIGRQLPWLLVSSRHDKPQCFYAPSCLHTKMAKYTIRLPQIEHHRRIGSSQGFLITIEGLQPGKICAINPLTGARFPLPPTATHPDILLYDDRRPDVPPRLIGPDGHTKVHVWYCKAVISPSMDTIAVAVDGASRERWSSQSFSNLAVARAGDDSWTLLMLPSSWRRTADFIFHKGLLYVLSQGGSLAIFNLENPAALQLVSPLTWINGAPCGAFLTETPDGEDLLSLRMCSGKTPMAFMLDKNTLVWNQVASIGDVALFFDWKYLSSFSTRSFPCLQRNCVYLSGANATTMQAGVYDLGNGRVRPFGPVDDLEILSWPFLFWFTPAL